MTSFLLLVLSLLCFLPWTYVRWATPNRIPSFYSPEPTQLVMVLLGEHLALSSSLAQPSLRRQRGQGTHQRWETKVPGAGKNRGAGRSLKCSR